MDTKTIATPFALTQAHASFPALSIPHPHGAPIEVHVLGQLGLGAGSHMIASMNLRQAQHPEYLDALDEPSTRIGAMHLQHDDPSTLYTFSVARGGHPWHRHAGGRVFTAISGSAGCELRFSTASDDEVELQPQLFLRRMHRVSIPPDCLFTVRFGRAVWHQFLASEGKHRHPALFAISSHPNELDGALSAAQKQQVEANQAGIASLTEVLPEAVRTLLAGVDWERAGVAHTRLAMHTPFQSMLAQCSRLRSFFGSVRQALVAKLSYRAYQFQNGGGRSVQRAEATPNALLDACLAPVDSRGKAVHTDYFYIHVGAEESAALSAPALLARLLEAFVEHPPLNVTRLMRIRNALVKPMGLRRSNLGCPVSSLLQTHSEAWFAQRFPVHAQQVDDVAQSAQVVLGADDKHLRFRTLVGVQKFLDGSARFYMSSRVSTKNLFGRFYLASINHTHQHYVSPLMLRTAVDHALSHQHESRNLHAGDQICPLKSSASL
jgi:hypothetical protein